MINSHASSDGDGVKIQRIALFKEVAADPFLMIDELRSDDRQDHIGGFPPHLHRGMETLTYLRQGSLQHQDHLGNRGWIKSGGAQWMSAGRGIIHSEMPALEMDVLHGFQLWINLPASQKMNAPMYRDVAASDIPHITTHSGVELTLIAGHWLIDDQEYHAPLNQVAADAGVADVHLNAGQQLTLPVAANYHAMAYVYQGILTGMSNSQSLVLLDTIIRIQAKNASQSLPIRIPTYSY
jgi:redox-sensitive bicupin YhaK (pirin superfamily)